MDYFFLNNAALFILFRCVLYTYITPNKEILTV